jgi:hypothetical protein
MLSASAAFCQKKEKPEQYKFMMKEILYTSDSTGVGSLEYTDEKKAGLAFVNDNAMLIKELDLPGKVLGIAGWKGNVLVVYVKEWQNEVNKEVHAALVSTASRSITSDKVIYQNPGNDQIECRVGKGPNGDFRYLFIRTTGLTGNTGKSMSWKEEKKWMTTKALQSVTLSDNMEPALHNMYGLLTANGAFLQSFADKKGGITIVGYANGNLTAEKFGEDGQLIKKLLQPLDCYAGDDYIPVGYTGKYDPSNENRLVFSIRNPDQKNKKTMLSTFLFDFAAGKTFSGQQVILEKDFFKEITSDPQLKSAKHFKYYLHHLTPITVDFAGDNILVCQEQMFTSMGDDHVPLYSSEGGIVYIYDGQMHQQKRILLDRVFDSFIDVGRGYSTRVRDGKLFLLGNELAGVGKYAYFYFIVDPEKGTLDKKMLEWPNISQNCPVDTRTVFWFKKNLLVTHASGYYFFKKHVDGYIAAANYQP